MEPKQLKMKRRKFTSQFKSKVVLEALKERSTLAELAQKFELTPQQISTWKREFIARSGELFEGKVKSKKEEQEEEKLSLLQTIGQQKVEIDFLKKKLK